MTGLKELQKKISERGFKSSVDKAMKAYVKQVVEDAKSEAPTQITYYYPGYVRVDPTNVGSSIYGSYNGGNLVFEVLDNQAPYIEFGTGRFAHDLMATRPKEWQELAMMFFKTGKGTLMSNPFMYPAITENQRIILEELEKNLNG